MLAPGKFLVSLPTPVTTSRVIVSGFHRGSEDPNTVFLLSTFFSTFNLTLPLIV